MIDSKKIEFGAEMTFKQFIALTVYLKSFDAVSEILNTPYFRKLRKAKNIDENLVKKRIFNGWNTERILRANSDTLNIKDNYFALQWSFPQAYYSIFMLALSFMHLNGQSTTTHSGIIQKFGEFAKSGHYPKMISFYCEGTIKNPVFHNIIKYPSKSSIAFDKDSIDSCQTQICQFLKATREILLKEKRIEKEIKKKFMTGHGKNQHIKNNLNESEWEIVAKKIAPTNILNLLYRKRIKSNYRDIDSFTYKGLKADYIHNSLIGIVKCLNLVHECYIYKSIGDKKYLSFYQEFIKDNPIPFLEKRMEIIANIVYYYSS